MERAIQILMERDGYTEQEAKDLIEETQNEILNSDPFEADDIIMNDLGLEPDYLLDILGY